MERLTDLRWQVRSSYLIAAGVGSGLSQYQWTVLRLTSLAQVRSSGLDFANFFSRKLYSSMSIWGRRRTVKNKETE